MLLSACARDSAQREPSPPPPYESKTETKPEVKTAATTAPLCPAPHVRRASIQHRHAEPPAHRVDPALLKPQPAPDCDYGRADLRTVDPDEWARLKAEYERQCYREAEKASRERLARLQASIQQPRD